MSNIYLKITTNAADKKIKINRKTYNEKIIEYQIKTIKDKLVIEIYSNKEEEDFFLDFPLSEKFVDLFINDDFEYIKYILIIKF